MPHWSSIHTIVFDFDGVFTDNKVWIDQDGRESVCCDRGDGLAFDVLRKFIFINRWDLNYFILSTEANPVVSVRANKLNIKCYQNSSDKYSFLLDYLVKNNFNEDGLLYVGNDLNDLEAMRLSGYSVAPSDAHILVKEQASLVLEKRGGEGFVRDIIEKLIRLDHLGLDQLKSLI